MARQTAMPGVLVKSIQAKSGGGGRTLEFEEGLPENIGRDRISSFLDNVTLFGSSSVNSVLIYNLEVAAYSEMSAKSKARAFVRMKNPFEIATLTISSSDKLRDLGVMKGGRSAYSVSVRVQK